jgi:3-oxoacyl-[acyl-carrier-protein] synthase III
MVAPDFVLDIVAQGAWNGGTRLDNSIYENQGMRFKGGIPVSRETIEERIGVRTRRVASLDERIGVIAFQDLLDTSGIDPARFRVLIAATNIGEDKFDPGPTSRYLYDRIRQTCPRALVFDLYAGCPGFNVSMEALYMLTLAGMLEAGDLAVIVGAENVHRAEAFKPLDTSNIIFGDDALATALEIGAPEARPRPREREGRRDQGDFIGAIAEASPWARRPPGFIIDNCWAKSNTGSRPPPPRARADGTSFKRSHGRPSEFSYSL